jgi:hypothetical protein
MIGFFILLSSLRLNSIFIPDRNDYNAYGLKIAMNEILFVQVHNVQNPPTFLVQFAPYNSTQNSLQCSININDLFNHYIYSVVISEVDWEFFFAGELINDRQGTFVGVIKMNCTNLITNMNQNQCNSSFSHSIQYLNQYEHEEYYKIGVKPKGTYVYGFSNTFIFVFDSKKIFLESWNGQLTWRDESFMPHAVHLTDDFGIIAGFIRNASDDQVKYLPIIYLINFNSSNHHPIVVDSFMPAATPGTWQDLLKNSDANIYSAKYDMSVSINEDGYILVGMPYINRVFFLSVDPSGPTILTNLSRFTNGRCQGYGKSVAWLDNGTMAAVLANIYSFHDDWHSSQIYIYDMKSRIYNSSTTPLSVFPNYHQKLPKKYSPIFLNIVSSSISLALLDSHGNVIIFVPTPPGTFPSIQKTGSMPLITSEQPCLPGTYKNQTGINDCILCPTDTKNSSDLNTQCISCSVSSFCPLGSSDETSLSALDEVIISFPYPRSSEISSFDGILFANVFGVTPNNCKFPRTMFYVMTIGLSFSLLLVTIMTIFKHCCIHPRITNIRGTMKKILKQIDFIGEGKFWLGGTLSLTLIILVVCTCKFAVDFYNLYPKENKSGSYFACDSTIVNAVFESSVKSLGLSQRSEEKKMLDLLDQQNFTLKVDFVNTLINCDVAELRGLFGTTWSTLRWSDCVDVNSTLSISIPLPHQHISVQVILDDIKTIGGLRIGLYGNEYINGSHILKELYFRKSFYKNGYVLGKNIPLFVTLTKVINETVSMEGETSIFSGIFVPICEVDLNNILLSDKQYIFSTLSSIYLQISLTESSYYEKNLQEPMAAKSQIIFHVILFIIVYLDLINLLFLFSILILRPMFYFIKDDIFCHRRQVPTEHLEEIVSAMKAHATSQVNIVISTKV